MKRLFLQGFIFCFIFLSFNFCCKQIGEDIDTGRSVVEIKSTMLFDNFIFLMLKCERYIEAWQFREKNINLYMISKGDFANTIKVRRDMINEIEDKIRFFEKKIYEYAEVVGKIYKLAEPFIEKRFIKLDESEENIYVDKFMKNIDAILPQNFSDSYFGDEFDKLRKLAPERKEIGKKNKYAIYTAVSIISLTLACRYRRFLFNFLKKFFKNQIVKPIRNLKDCLFSSYDEDDFLSMSPKEILRDLEAQKNVLKQKIKELAVEIDQDIDPDVLDGMLEQEASVERFVAMCVEKANNMPQSSSSKPGWIEWLFVGNKVHNFIGMSPRQKFLEVEIKGLLSRLVATRLLLDAKDGMDSNKLTLVLGSMLPFTLTVYSVYKLFNKIYDWRYGISKKKKSINSIMFKLSHVINRNIGNVKISDLDQGLICYFVQRFKSCLSVAPENVCSSIEHDLFCISSCSNDMNKKFQIFQSLKIILYSR